jgi:hypothetical protein
MQPKGIAVGSNVAKAAPKERRKSQIYKKQTIPHQDVKRTYTSKPAIMHGVPNNNGSRILPSRCR